MSLDTDPNLHPAPWSSSAISALAPLRWIASLRARWVPSARQRHSFSRVGVTLIGVIFAFQALPRWIASLRARWVPSARQRHSSFSRVGAALISAIVSILSLPTLAAAAQIELLNVSYDPTREFYQEFNQRFIDHWKAKTGDDVIVAQSHGGSGKQSRAVLDGLEADIVTLGLGYDIDILADNGLVDKQWQQAFPDNSAPYTSTIVFLVRKGNPKGIKNWDDLVKTGISVITPNPKTSGGARWNFLAALAYAESQFGRGDARSVDFIKALYKNVPVLDSGARGSTATFVQRGIGDVLIAWENEAFLSLREFGNDKFEIVTPSVSILAEPPVAVVTKNTERKGTTKVAKAYLDYLYSDEGQDIAGKNFFRPRAVAAAAKYAAQFPKIKLATIADFGGWRTAQQKYFKDGGLFDQIYAGSN